MFVNEMKITDFFTFFFLSVTDLKHAIHSKYKIAIQHQVLVVNGGECMAADRRVCTYSAGTVGVQEPFHSDMLELHMR